MWTKNLGLAYPTRDRCAHLCPPQGWALHCPRLPGLCPTEPRLFLGSPFLGAKSMGGEVAAGRCGTCPESPWQPGFLISKARLSGLQPCPPPLPMTTAVLSNSWLSLIKPHSAGSTWRGINNTNKIAHVEEGAAAGAGCGASPGGPSLSLPSLSVWGCGPSPENVSVPPWGHP